MRPLEPVELTLRCFGKRRVGTDCHWVIRDRAGESSSGVVLDGPVRVRDRFPQPYVESQVPYAGLAVGKYLWLNSTAEDRDLHYGMMLKWVQDQPYLKRSNGWVRVIRGFGKKQFGKVNLVGPGARECHVWLHSVNFNWILASGGNGCAILIV